MQFKDNLYIVHVVWQQCRPNPCAQKIGMPFVLGPEADQTDRMLLESHLVKVESFDMVGGSTGSFVWDEMWWRNCDWQFASTWNLCFYHSFGQVI